MACPNSLSFEREDWPIREKIANQCGCSITPSGVQPGEISTTKVGQHISAGSVKDQDKSGYRIKCGEVPYREICQC